MTVGASVTALVLAVASQPLLRRIGGPDPRPEPEPERSSDEHPSLQ